MLDDMEVWLVIPCFFYWNCGKSEEKCKTPLLETRLGLPPILGMTIFSKGSSHSESAFLILTWTTGAETSKVKTWRQSLKKMSNIKNSEIALTSPIYSSPNCD